MPLRIDHVTIAGQELAPLQEALARAGLPSVYGGPHSNGITHMAILGMDDGSYVELIAAMSPGSTSPLWGAHIAGNSGPCAWAAGSQDIAADVERARAADISVRGPVYMNRRRPDGVLVEWDLAFLGEGEPGSVLPFLIQDRTPREWRVTPTPGLAGAELNGVGLVVLGVPDLDEAAALFRRLWSDWPAPQVTQDAAWGARLAHWPGQPVALACPSSAGWLADRLARWGACPCAYALLSLDLAASVRRFPVSPPAPWLGHQVAWFDPDRLNGVRLGILG